MADSSYSILIPTYNRAPFVERLLSFLSHAGITAPVVIADGSDDEHRERNSDLILRKQRDGLDVRHFVARPGTCIEKAHNCQFGYVPRLSLAIKEIHTPFVQLLCDDCFVSPEFLDEATNILQSEPTTSAVIGQIWTVWLDKTRTTTQTNGPCELINLVGPIIPRAGTSALERLVGNAHNHQLNTLWSMHRRDHLTHMLEAGRDATLAIANAKDTTAQPGHAEEFGLDFLHAVAINLIALIQGNVRFVPRLNLGHQIHADNWGLKLNPSGPGLNEVIMGPNWSLMAAPFIKMAANLLSKQDAISEDEAMTVVQSFLLHAASPQITHNANLRFQKISDNACGSSEHHCLREYLKGVPGLQRSVRAIRARRRAYLQTKRDKRDRRLAEASDVKRVLDFLENGPS